MACIYKKGIKIIKGNIFTSKAQTLVNAVNTVGVMGAGIALEFRLRYPQMYDKYILLCKEKRIDIGKLWIYKSKNRWILNFPTKENWKDDSKLEYLEKGLKKFVNSYKQKGIKSIAFPILGSNNGNIPKETVLTTMIKYLNQCNIPIEIYEYDPNSEDDLIKRLYQTFEYMTIEEIEINFKVKKHIVIKLKEILFEKEIKNLISLIDFGIGLRTLEKIYVYFQN